MTTKETTEFHNRLKSYIQYWKRVLGIKGRVVLRREQIFSDPNDLFKIEFDKHQAVVRYNLKSLYKKPTHCIQKYVIHELIHHIHNDVDDPLFQYCGENEAFQGAYKKSCDAMEDMCDRLAAIIYKLDARNKNETEKN